MTANANPDADAPSNRMTLVPAASETIEGVSQDVRSGRKRCTEVLEACLAQIDAREPAVRAWVQVDRERARTRAQELDAELAAGRWLGPLHGIPIGIKDIIEVEGLPTAAGSKRWASRVARHDALLVARLRAAGAIILGKTVTTQYAWIDPPVTRNPWNLERTPGGSSSGSAAAVATGMCLGAVGSQTGGSITRPASFCGVCGLKPTHGRLSLTGILPLAPSLDHPGPIARTVRDLHMMWNVLAGDARERDREGAGGRAGSGAGGALPAAEHLGPLRRPPRLGRLHGLFHDHAEPAAIEAIDAACARLAAAGAAMSEPELPESFADVLAHHRTVMAAEVAAGHQKRLGDHPEDYQPRITALITEGLSIPAVHYVRSRQHQEQLRREIMAAFERTDAFVTPATLGPAPDPSTTGDAAFNSPWSYTGLPTISFPVGLSAEGLPLAIQLVGRPLGEANLFRIALWCENVIHGQHDALAGVRRGGDRPGGAGGGPG